MTTDRRAEIRTTHDDSKTVAAALDPDNTDEMETVVEGDAVLTRIERETTGGLHATVDDYVVNLDVAARASRAAREVGDRDGPASQCEATDTNGDGIDANERHRERERSDTDKPTETHDDTQ